MAFEDDLKFGTRSRKELRIEKKRIETENRIRQIEGYKAQATRCVEEFSKLCKACAYAGKHSCKSFAGVRYGANDFYGAIYSSKRDYISGLSSFNNCSMEDLKLIKDYLEEALRNAGFLNARVSMYRSNEVTFLLIKSHW